MEIMEHLFVGESVSDLETIVYALRRNLPVAGLTCIVLSKKRKQVEILSARQMLEGNFSVLDGVVLGVAHGKAEAVQLLRYMIKEFAEDGKDIANPSTWLEGEILDEKSI